jgi:hypothetical protein
MFKVDWEKTSVTYQLQEGMGPDVMGPEGMVEHMVEKMVRLAYREKKLTTPGTNTPHIAAP